MRNAHLPTAGTASPEYRHRLDWSPTPLTYHQTQLRWAANSARRSFHSDGMDVRAPLVPAMLLTAALTLTALPASASASSTTHTAIPTSTTSSSALVVTAGKPAASVVAIHRTRANGKVRVVVTSNARKVKIRFRTAQGKKRVVVRKVRKGTARVTLPAGARSIKVRARATSKLRAGRWVASQPAPVSLPTPLPATPPAQTVPAVPPVAEPVISTPSAPVVVPPQAPAIGYDVSWPQCATTLPTGQAFAMVGVNNGLANNTNPCLPTQLAWAHTSSGTTSQPRAALYVNTANPGLIGSWWPESNLYPESSLTPVPNPYGACTGEQDAACAYIYGYAKAHDDANIRGVVDPASYFWWLDVEIENSWEGSTVANRADLEGMTYYFTEVLRAAGVGIYSTTYQWAQIVRSVGPVTSPTIPPAASILNGLPSWIAGATDLVGAQANCSAASLTGGPVTVTQYLLEGLDHNHACL